MDDLTDYSSPVVEFRGSVPSEQQRKYVDNSTGTTPMAPSKDQAVETNRNHEVSTQTMQPHLGSASVDDNKLANWLRKIYPQVEEQLAKGLTPTADSGSVHSQDSGGGQHAEPVIQMYQKITIAEAAENSKGLATWLAVQTNNAPALVVTHIPPHDDWCAHVEQYMKVYVPQRLAATGNFVVFAEAKTVPLKACLANLATNPYNKNIFAGCTVDGDIYVWEYQPAASGNSVEIRQLFSVASTYGCAAALDWCGENRLLTAHTNGVVRQWLMGKDMLVEAEFLIKNSNPHEISALVSLSANDFVVGSKDGGVYHCSKSSMAGGLRKSSKITEFKRHLFAVTSLLKTKISNSTMVISCDLSGQIYYHDVPPRLNGDATEPSVMLQIALPFKNAIACLPNAKTLYCPGGGGSLQCIRVRDGVVSTVKGSLNGKGNFIKSSDNGCWLIVGLYDNEYQIFNIEH